MTLLQLVNNILRRLREDEVSAIGESDYSLMVVDYVNDAKDIVENSYQWSALREDIAVTTVLDQTQYTLTGTNDRSKLVLAYNDTEDCELEYRDAAWIRRHESNAGTGKPAYYTFDGVSSTGDIKVKVFPKPVAGQSLSFQVVNPQEALENGATRILAPTKPIIYLALAFLARERGETGGTSAAELFSIAERYITDAIAIDAARHPEELIYFSV